MWSWETKVVTRDPLPSPLPLHCIGGEKRVRKKVECICDFILKKKFLWGEGTISPCDIHGRRNIEGFLFVCF